MLNEFGRSFCDSCIEYSKSDCNIGILVKYFGKNITDFDNDVKLFLAFSNKRLFFGFAWLDLDIC